MAAVAGRFSLARQAVGLTDVAVAIAMAVVNFTSTLGSTIPPMPVIHATSVAITMGNRVGSADRCSRVWKVCGDTDAASTSVVVDATSVATVAHPPVTQAVAIVIHTRPKFTTVRRTTVRPIPRANTSRATLTKAVKRSSNLLYRATNLSEHGRSSDPSHRWHAESQRLRTDRGGLQPKRCVAGRLLLPRAFKF